MRSNAEHIPGNRGAALQPPHPKIRLRRRTIPDAARSINMPVHIFEKSALEKGLKEHQAKFDIPAEDLLSLIARYQI